MAKRLSYVADPVAEIDDAACQLIERRALLGIGLAGKLLDPAFHGVEPAVQGQLQLANAGLHQGEAGVALALILSKQQFTNLIHPIIILVGRPDGRPKLRVRRGVHGHTLD